MSDHGKQFDDYIGVRLSKKDKDKFVARCAFFKKPHAEMLRELIQAFSEEKVTIHVSSDQLNINILKGVHHVK